MKGLIITLALLIAASVTSAQYLNKTYDIDTSNDWGYHVFVQPDGNYFIIGSGNRGRWQQNAMFIHPKGSLLQNKVLLKSPSYSFYNGSPGGAKILPNGYIVPITAVRSIAGGNYKKLGGLAKLDANGDTVWVRYYTDTTQHAEFMNVCNLMPDGGYIVAGSREFSTNPANFLGVLIRTDSNGNLIWYKTLANSINFGSADYVGNGQILVGAAFHYRPRFVVYDTFGNVIKDTIYNSKYTAGGTSYKDKNGGYFHYAQLDSLLFPGDPNDYRNYPHYVAHLDDSFNIVWLKSLASTKFKKSIWNVKQLKDGNYLLVGQSVDTSKVQTGGWAMKLDKNGFVMWDGHYINDTNTSFTYLVDAAERPDGSIVMTGTVGSTSQHTQELWVVVVDSMGCIIPNCAPTSVPKQQPKDLALRVFPNPTRGVFSVKAESNGKLTLTNIQGVLLTNYTVHRGHTELHLPNNISAGIYVLKYVSDDGREIASFRLVYQP